MTVFDDPDLFLNRFDEISGVPLGLGDAQFIRVAREELSKLSFLDQRELDKPVEFRLSLDAFASQADTARTDHAFGMIYHSAFCCSTYLARCLDVTGIGRSLKEPYALTQTSFYAADETCQQFDNQAQWDRFLHGELAFLSRPAETGTFPVIKTHNFSIVLAQDIARLFPDRVRGLFIYSEAQSFLISTLKSRERRNFSRLLLKLLSPEKAERLGIPWFDAELLPDGSAAAYCWLMHMAYYRQAATQWGDTGFRALDCETLLAQPLKTMASLASYFGQQVSHEQLIAGLADPATKSHAKNPGSSFSTELRRTDMQTQGFVFRKEIKEAMRWFDALDLREELRSAPAFTLAV